MLELRAKRKDLASSESEAFLPTRKAIIGVAPTTGSVIMRFEFESLMMITITRTATAIGAVATGSNNNRVGRMTTGG